MSKKRIVIIGGVAAGPKTAARARRRDPDADITIIERGEWLSYAGCGLPYYVQGVIEEADELHATPMGVVRDADFFRDAKDVRVLTRTEVTRIDRDAHFLEVTHLETGETDRIPYDKLVIATGASPFVPPIEGVDLAGVFRLYHPTEAIAMRNAVEAGHVRRATIIGGGLIGMETAEALATHGVEVTVVEMMDQILPALLDFEIAAFLRKHLVAKGIQIRTGERVQRLEGDKGKVVRVVTDAGVIDSDLVLVAVGIRPNTKLARDAGLEVGASGGIRVNDRLQTSDPDIYAGGDCVENHNLVVGGSCFVPLGSTANKHGRVIADNLTGGDARFPGVLGTTIFKAFDYAVGRVGLTERQARQAGHEVVTAIVPGPDRAHYMPAAQTLLIKLVVDANDGRVLGAQVVGPGDVNKRLDVLATAMHFRATVDDLSAIDLSYAPPYSSAIDPVATAANVVRNKREGLAPSLTPIQVKEKMDRGDDFILLDVRTPGEYEAMRIDDPRVRLLPLDKLRSRLSELPRDKEIVTLCKVSLRGYEALRILAGAGFENVRLMDGGLAAWPYTTVSGRE